MGQDIRRWFLVMGKDCVFLGLASLESRKFLLFIEIVYKVSIIWYDHFDKHYNVIKGESGNG